MMRKSESGQALVLVLLSLAVVLTLVLFILSRSVTDVSVSSGQADSVRAFSAAEAGIEKTLVVGVGTGPNGSSIGDAVYSASISNTPNGTSDFIYPGSLLSGDTMTTWFVSHDANGNALPPAGTFDENQMQICWGNFNTEADTTTTPAIELSIYYESTPGDYSTAKIARATFDPNLTRSTPNSFVQAGGTCQIEDIHFAFQGTVTFSSLGINPGGLIFARAKMLYNTDAAHIIGIAIPTSTLPSQQLPSQGQSVASTGTAGQSNRKISVFQGWPEFPFGGDSLFSPNGITK